LRKTSGLRFFFQLKMPVVCRLGFTSSPGRLARVSANDIICFIALTLTVLSMFPGKEM
jgi:hypothetical protein